MSSTVTEVRNWLNDNGFQPGARGRLNPKHVTAWEQAHPGQEIVSTPKPTKAAVKSSAPVDDDPTTDGLTREEMETTINITMVDSEVQVYTCIKRHLSQMRKDPNYTEVESGFYGSTAWGRFTCPVDKFRFGSRKTMNLSEEEKAKRSARMSALHSK